MTLIAMIMILIGIETDYRYPAPVGDNGAAVGILQIQPVMVAECNRLAGYERWTLDDRNSQAESVEMAKTFFNHQIKKYVKRYNRKPSAFRLLQSWNTGNIFIDAPERYIRRINRFLGPTRIAAVVDQKNS